ncbi:MAG: cation diffusion facilitator family transporter [Patescibacteria group bacterium]
MIRIIQSKRVSGFVPVFLAFFGNAFITVIKFVGFFLSGSGALFSEAIHSLADTMNQGLLMVGLKLSTKKADEDFSYGYGQERFLWALISACGIFFLGAGVTIYRGIDSLIHPESVHISPIIFGILIVAFVIETITFIAAARELKKHNPDSTLSEILEEGDPTTIAVLYEDGVAVLGVLIALGSIFLTLVTGHAYWDAIGSIIIGALLGVVAVVLIAKNRAYLIGKNIPEEMKDQVIEMLEADPAIEKVLDFKSSVLDVHHYQIKCEVEFNGSALMKEMFKKGFIKEEYEFVKDDYQEFIKFLVDYADRVPRLIGTRIDKIEKRIQNKIPSIKHIDIEIN